jgi:hypothetical protein
LARPTKKSCAAKLYEDKLHVSLKWDKQLCAILDQGAREDEVTCSSRPGDYDSVLFHDIM